MIFCTAVLETTWLMSHSISSIAERRVAAWVKAFTHLIWQQAGVVSLQVFFYKNKEGKIVNGV